MIAERPNVVILHGANGSGSIMQPLADVLGACASVWMPNLLGHGGRPIPERLTMDDMARDVIEYIDRNALATAFIFGYSSGGTLALYLARHYAQRVSGVCTLAAKHVFDQKTVDHWVYLANPKRLSRPGNKRAGELAQTHHPQNWESVVSAIRELFLDLGRRPPLSDEDLRSIAQPALVFSSNEDQIVPVEETVALGKLLPNARVVLFKGKSHPFHIVPIDAIGKATCSWIAEVQQGATLSGR